MQTHSNFVEFKFDGVGDKAGHFTGYGSIFGNVDSYGDVIERGAFAATLREWESRGKLPKMLLQHGGMGFGGAASDGIPVGAWTKMEENSKGLRIEGFIDPVDTDEGKKIYAGLKNGTLDGLSIGFRAKKYTLGTKTTEPRRTLHEIDLLEVSIVTFPANPKSLVSSIKSHLRLGAEECRELEAILRTKDLSNRDAAKAVSGFKQWLQREAADDEGDHRDDDTPALKGLLDAIRGARTGLNQLT